jgi:hypothetical protein
MESNISMNLELNSSNLIQIAQTIKKTQKNGINSAQNTVS